MSYKDKLIDQAISALTDSGVVPIDLIYELTSMGIDYSVLEEKYSVIKK